MSIKVDQTKCISCGMCVGTCPKTFNIGTSGKAEAISQEDKNCAKQAMGNCPVGAISVS